jgi:hypothetical protein
MWKCPTCGVYNAREGKCSYGDPPPSSPPSSKLFRRWYWWLPALLVAAAVGYVGYRATHPPWKDTEAWQKYQEIHLGMTFAKVVDGRGDRGQHGWAIPGRLHWGSVMVW